MITAIVPTYNQIYYVTELFESINENEVKPERIVLIDDCGTDNMYKIVKKYKNLNIEFIKHSSNKGVNYCWNEGINLSNTEVTTFLNSDVVLNKYFFKKLIESCNKRWTLICPVTVKAKENIYLSKDELIMLEAMGKREGWCWSGKTKYLKQIYPIPSELGMYFGDDYVFFRANQDNLPVLKMMNNFVFHYGGKTVSVTESCCGLRQRERIEWNKYVKNFQKDKYENSNLITKSDS